MRDLLFFHTWWTWTQPADWSAWLYHSFNLVEGCAWVSFSLLVLIRYLRHRYSRLELLYSLAFLTFGLSDFREAWVLESWLILAKGANLILLLWLRSLIIQRYYPESKTY